MNTISSYDRGKITNWAGILIVKLLFKWLINSVIHIIFMNLGGPPVVLGGPVHIQGNKRQKMRESFLYSIVPQIQAMHDLSPSGRLGPMVTCTLKLGISILNGGNVQVQQVRLSDFTVLIFNYLFYCQRMNRLECSRIWLCTGCLMFFHLVIPRKCLITWKRKEMQASLRASRDWCSLAGTIISTGPPRKKN